MGMFSAQTNISRRKFIQGSGVALAAPFLVSCGRSPSPPADPQVPAVPPGIPSTPTLKQVAAKTRRTFGAALEPRHLNPSGVSYETFVGECSSLTPEWSLKWDALARDGNTYDFSDVDRLVAFARQHGMSVRGHSLLWHLGTPKWAEILIAETREWEHVRSYFRTVMSRYAGTIREWDVINEPIDVKGRPDGLRNNQFMRAFGPEYIDWAFWTCHEIDPGGRRVLNEYGLEYPNTEEVQRRRALLKLLEGMVRRGLPITGLGMQAHLDLRKGPVCARCITEFMREVSGMGLEIAVTELDVHEADVRMSTERRDTAVADEVRRYLDVVLQFDAVKSVSTWGLKDDTSWLTYQPGNFPNNRGLPYDAQWRPKKMRRAILDALA